MFPIKNIKLKLIIPLSITIRSILIEMQDFRCYGLSKHLKDLEKLYIIFRHAIDAKPIRVLYACTEFGAKLFTTLMLFILFFINPKPFMA